MGRWRATGTSGLVLLLAVLSSCADAGQSSYVHEKVARLEVDRPLAWATDFPVQAPWTKGFRLNPTSVEQLQISGDFGEYLSAAQGMGTLIGQAQVGLKGFTVVISRDVAIKGATTGRVTRYTITDNNGSQVAGEWIVAARWPYPQSVAVSILTPQFDPELERQVLASMELVPSS